MNHDIPTSTVGILTNGRLARAGVEKTVMCDVMASRDESIKTLSWLIPATCDAPCSLQKAADHNERDHAGMHQHRGARGRSGGAAAHSHLPNRPDGQMPTYAQSLDEPAALRLATGLRSTSGSPPP